MESIERELKLGDLSEREQDELSVVLRVDHFQAIVDGHASVVAALRMIEDERKATVDAVVGGASVLANLWYSAYYDLDYYAEAIQEHGEPSSDGGKTLSGVTNQKMRKDFRPKLWRNGIRASMCAIAIRERIGGGRLLMVRQGIPDCLLPNGKPLAVLHVLDRLDDNVVEPAETQTARRIRLAVEAAQRFTAPDAPGREHFKSERPGRKGRGIPMTLRRAVGNQVAREEGLEKAPSGRTVDRWLHDGSYNLPLDLRFPVKG